MAPAQNGTRSIKATAEDRLRCPARSDSGGNICPHVVTILLVFVMPSAGVTVLIDDGLEFETVNCSSPTSQRLLPFYLLTGTVMRTATQHLVERDLYGRGAERGCAANARGYSNGT